MVKRSDKMKVLMLVSCMAVSSVLACGSISGARGSDAEALQAMGDVNEEKIAEQVKEFRKEDALQQDAKDAYGELMDVVEDNAAVEKNYAGAYIDDDNQLVVNLTTSSEKVQDMVQDGTESQEVKIQRKKYTYDELKEVRNQIENAIIETKYYEIVSSICVSQKENAVVVRMTDPTYANSFRKDICNDECVQIDKEAHKISPDKTYLKPGGYIGLVSGNYYSIGWRGWRINNAGNYTEGLVTAGHGNRVGDEAVTSGGHSFGKFVKKRFGGNLDATFVQRTSNSFDVSNTIKFSGSSLKAGYYVRSSNIAEGQKVYKVGMKTGLTQGYITDPSVPVSYKEYDGAPLTSFTDYVEADYNADHGDSGGLVYTDVSGAYRIIGNHVCSTSSGKKISYFVKADNIINQMEIYPY